MDKTKAEEKVVETDTTQTTPPVVEEAPTEPQTTPEAPVDQSAAVEKTDDFPEDAAEQRRAFQEQRLEIKRLKTEKEARSKGESAFNAFRQQVPPSPVNPVNIQDYTDPVTGETNLGAYNQAVNGAIAKTQEVASFQAKQTAEDLIDENNARTKFPEVMDNSETEREVADLWLAAKLRGENPLVSEIASRIAKREGKTASKAEKIGAEKILTEVSEKEQASLSAVGQTSAPTRQVASQEELESQRVQTRYGNDEAITARVSKIPWANK